MLISLPCRQKAIWFVHGSNLQNDSLNLIKDKAVVRFADWLTTQTVEREVKSGLGAGKAKIVLCGHRYILYTPAVIADVSNFFSMGGLLAADTLREFVNTSPDKTAPLWPKIVACIAFDTPVSQEVDLFPPGPLYYS